MKTNKFILVCFFLLISFINTKLAQCTVTERSNYGMSDISADTSQSWVFVGFANQGVYSLASLGIELLAGSDVGVEYSTNDGLSWNQTGLNVSSVLALDVDGTNIVAGTNNKGVFFSTNGGLNWTQNQFTTQFIFAVALKGNNLLASPEWSPYDGLFEFTNFGFSWNKHFFSSADVYALSKNSNYVFAGFLGVYRSSDNGLNWVPLNLNSIYIFSLTTNGPNIYAGTSNEGVYISTDNGQNWNQTSLGNLSILSIAALGSDIFAGSMDNGVFVSTDDGNNWTQINQGIGNQRIRSLLISNGYVFAGTNSQGLWRRSLNEITGIKSIKDAIPNYFNLSQNYPNPFNPSTVISYQLPNKSYVKLIVYDVIGSEVKTLVNEKQSAGAYQVEFDGSKYPSNVYFYRIQVIDDKGNISFSDTKKMVLLK